MKGKKEMIINEVRTVNFPFETIDGETHYPLHSAAVVERITAGIPEAAKASVTIDYDQIPEAYVQQVKQELGIRPADPASAEASERKLIEALKREGAWQ